MYEMAFRSTSEDYAQAKLMGGLKLVAIDTETTVAFLISRNK